MSSIVDRVRKLIALAGSANEHESRSAAVTACRLIRQHGLQIGDPSPRARHVDREQRRRSTSGPYTRARGVYGSACRECAEPIPDGEVFHDAEEAPVHGDCIPRGERP